MASDLLDAPRDRVYTNQGNPPLLALLLPNCTRLLDVGCGAGDNAALVARSLPDCEISGITHSQAEAWIAGRYMKHCWVFDIEGDFPANLTGQKFDALIFSHVLEHLREAAAALAKFTRLLNTGGIVLIAVPNILFWRQRIKFLFGSFEYEPMGIMDETHLRFVTFDTADRYLLAQSADLELLHKGATGSVPLWWLRRYFIPRSWSDAIDAWGCRHWPNLFGAQILIKARKK